MPSRLSMLGVNPRRIGFRLDSSKSRVLRVPKAPKFDRLPELAR